MRPRPVPDEVVDLRVGGDHAREVALDRTDECLERRLAARRREQEVVRRRLHRRGGRHTRRRSPPRSAWPRTGRVPRPASLRHRGSGCCAPRPRAERPRLGQEGARVLEQLDLGHSSSSTTAAPPATRSPSATWTVDDDSLVRRDERRLHLHRLEDDERLARLHPVAFLHQHAEHRTGHRGRDRAVLGPFAVRVSGCLVGRGVGRGDGEVEPEASAPRWRQRPARLGQRRVLDEEGGRRLAGPHGRMADQPAEERQVRDHSLDLGVRERARRAGRAPRRASRLGRSAWRSSGRRRSRSRRPPRSLRRRGSLRGAAAARAGRSGGGRCADPRRRDGPRPHDRAATGGSGSGPPSASSSWAATRSSPVTSSVTGCSTWIRPFSSRKKNSCPSTTNSAVPALR